MPPHLPHGVKVAALPCEAHQLVAAARHTGWADGAAVQGQGPHTACTAAAGVGAGVAGVVVAAVTATAAVLKVQRATLQDTGKHHFKVGCGMQGKIPSPLG